MKYIACTVQRLQEVSVIVAVGEDATREDIDEALILAADDQWATAITIETYPNGPRSVMEPVDE